MRAKNDALMNGAVLRPPPLNQALAGRRQQQQQQSRVLYNKIVIIPQKMKRDAALFFLTTTQFLRSWNDPNHWECLHITQAREKCEMKPLTDY